MFQKENDVLQSSDAIDSDKETKPGPSWKKLKEDKPIEGHHWIKNATTKPPLSLQEALQETSNILSATTSLTILGCEQCVYTLGMQGRKASTETYMYMG